MTRNRILAIVLLFVVLAGAAYWHHASSQARFDAAIADARARGIPTFEELSAAGADIPDDENAAVAYERAFEILRSAPDAPAASLVTQEMIDQVKAEALAMGAPVRSDEDIREFLSLDPRNTTLKHLPIFGYADVHDDRREALPGAMLEAARAYIEARKEAMGLLHRRATLEQCRYSDRPHAQRYLGSTREAARLLALGAWVDAEDARDDAALGKVSDTLALAGTVVDGLDLMNALVGRGTCSIALRTGLERVLARADPSDEALLHIQKELADAAEGLSAKGPMYGGIAIFIEDAERICRGDYEGAPGSIAVEVGKEGLIVRLGLKRFIRKDIVERLGLLIDFCESAEPVTPGFLKSIRGASMPVLFLKPRSLLTHTTWVYAAGILQVESLRGRLRSGAAAVAAERFRRTTGAWPESLEALVPEYLDSLPVDPFTGNGLILRRLENGLVIYSVGENGTDDNALPVITPPEGKDSHDWESPYDDAGFRLWDKESARVGQPWHTRLTLGAMNRAPTMVVRQGLPYVGT